MTSMAREPPATACLPNDNNNMAQGATSVPSSSYHFFSLSRGSPRHGETFPPVSVGVGSSPALRGQLVPRLSNLPLCRTNSAEDRSNNRSLTLSTVATSWPFPGCCWKEPGPKPATTMAVTASCCLTPSGLTLRAQNESNGGMKALLCCQKHGPKSHEETTYYVTRMAQRATVTTATLEASTWPAEPLKGHADCMAQSTAM